jgi:SAM-dependent methyltransferase
MSIKWFGKAGAGRTSTAPEGGPYPFPVRRRTLRKATATGIQVFDTPEAEAINHARMAHLESLKLPIAGKRVLDVGCGVGHLAAHLAQMGVRVTCVDAREENIAALHRRYPQFAAHVANAERDPLSALGQFDVVFSYGLLYHLENPAAALRNMASAAGELLLLETIICDARQPVVLLEDERFSANEALGALGCRPSPSYIATALNRIGFGHVYTSRIPPDHEDFRFAWLNNLEWSRDGHPLRAFFAASRTPVQNHRLVSMLTA